MFDRFGPVICTGISAAYSSMGDLLFFFVFTLRFVDCLISSLEVLSVTTSGFVCDRGEENIGWERLLSLVMVLL